MNLRSGRFISYKKPLPSKKRKRLHTSKVFGHEELVKLRIIDADDVRIIEKSLICPQIGRAVVANRVFEENDLVCSYGGQILDRAQYDQLCKENANACTERLSYFLYVHQGCTIDGHPDLPESKGHAGIFVNDPRGIAGQKENVCFHFRRPDAESVQIFLKALCRIEVGSELRLD